MPSLRYRDGFFCSNHFYINLYFLNNIKNQFSGIWSISQHKIKTLQEINFQFYILLRNDIPFVWFPVNTKNILFKHSGSFFQSGKRNGFLKIYFSLILFLFRPKYLNMFTLWESLMTISHIYTNWIAPYYTDVICLLKRSNTLCTNVY